MKLSNLILPVIALGAAAVLLTPGSSNGWSTIGGSLSQSQRDFRTYNNFTDSSANNNQTPHSQFPGAQGAVMAIEDGMVLARCVEHFGIDVEASLLRYESLRLERTAKTIRGSNENADRFHNSQLGDAAGAQRYVDTEWQPKKIRERYDWLFTYDATSVEI